MLCVLAHWPPAGRSSRSQERVKGQRLALAEVASLVKVGGADVSLDRVKLTVKVLDVKALLEVRLDEVRR